MKRSIGLLAALASCLLAASTLHAEADLTEIRESFEKGRWDRHWWSVDQHTPPGLKVDTSAKSLRFVIPPSDSSDRPPTAIKGRFRLEGDFDIQTAYSAKPLTQPKTGWINIQIFIDGPVGPAAVMRTSHSVEGSGYSLWWQPAQEGVPGGWDFEPTESLKGTLRLSRLGETLHFLYADGDGSKQDADFVEIGNAKYGALPITNVELWVTVPETESPVDVTFDDIVVTADRIVDPTIAAESPIGPRAWYWLAGVLTVLLLGVGAWGTWQWWLNDPLRGPGRLGSESDGKKFRNARN